MPAYAPLRQPFVRPPDLNGGTGHTPVAIVGAGPVGLALAIDLAQRGVASVVLDDNDVVSIGSRAICWAKRTLEIFDRLGIGERMLAKGVTWQTGRLFHGDREVYAFDLLPEAGHKYPAFINLQQYYVEEFLIDRARDFPDLIDLRFLSEVVDHAAEGDGVRITVDTPEGRYDLIATWLVACDGAGSPTRKRMGLPFEGQTFEEQFLIADIEMAGNPFGDGPPERWFWFDPVFHPGKSALLHQQPDNIYRIDLQLDPGSDPASDMNEDRVMSRIRAITGGKPLRLDWISLYRFRCMRLDRFVHGRVIFAGDSAHVVSPFGARGGNGGIQDIDNLGWKLAAVVSGAAPHGLIDSYDVERGHAADENIRYSTRATNFMTPKSPIEALFRAETLRLAQDQPFARRMINSGRLSQPCHLSGFGPQTLGGGTVAPGTTLIDAPVGMDWLVSVLPLGLCLVGFGDVVLPDVAGLARIGVGQRAADYPCYPDRDGFAMERYGRDIAYLIRPDGYVAACFARPDAESVHKAMLRALGHPTTTEVT
ncbi:FAD-dependent monooxygenase [Puniceibacterium sp. IMCC21224]|uniref:FAD-dependent monooxygenase n=1 Tax=Puniceibacterium sp. IMCC21224 TaxID=1618204 RepID=UPI00064DE86A|nr:FAD-dependent monooxygenase [Puniceibacterium sp. IMCC21224]KMK67999.1 2-polyprenyl-6-methoxyphenol hydroxylase-like oxidoreductase [Puniceibacterium sp. IMCC21224]